SSTLLFFSQPTPTPHSYTLSLHDALPISALRPEAARELWEVRKPGDRGVPVAARDQRRDADAERGRGAGVRGDAARQSQPALGDHVPGQRRPRLRRLA